MSPPPKTEPRRVLPREGDPLVDSLERQVAQLEQQSAFVRSELAERTLERDRWRGVAASLERDLAAAKTRERTLVARVDELELELRYRPKGPS